MPNSVLNFSLHTAGLSSEQLSAFASAEPSTVSVDADLPAREAAAVASKGGQQVVLVRREQELVGLFFPDYVHDLLPEHDLADGLELTLEMHLQEMIDRIDHAGREFHSERVNHFPSLRKCPRGHITSEDPCPRHSVSTEPYP